MSAPERSGRRRTWLGCGLVAAGAIAAYANTLAADFTVDDVACVVRNDRLASLANVPLFFREHFLAHDPVATEAGLYRPLTLVSLALDRVLFGLDARASHAVNVALHALASVLAFLVARRLVTPFAALAAGLLFALHPVHTEAVANVVGRAEILAAIGIFGATLAVERARAADRAAAPGATRRAALFGAIAALAFAGALLSKESAIVWPALWLALEIARPSQHWLLVRSPRALATLGSIALVVASFLWLRANATSPPARLMGLAAQPAGARLATAVHIVWENLVLCVAPVDLLAAYTSDDVPISASLFASRPLLAALWLTATGVGLALLRKQLDGALFGYVWFLVALAPTSNLFLAIGTMRAERFLYTPSFGVCIALGAMLDALRTRASTRVAAAALSIVCALYAARTWRRNQDWRDNVTIARATLALSPRSPLAHGILADDAFAAGDFRAARRHLASFLQHSSAANGYAMLGEIEQKEGRTEAAIAAFREALRRDPRRSDVAHSLSQLLLTAERWSEALPLLEALVRARPDDPSVAANRCFVFSALGEHERAADAARAAAQRFPSDALLLEIASQALRAAGHASEADAVAERAARARSGALR